MSIVLLVPLMFAAASPGFDADEYLVLDAVLAHRRLVDGGRPVLLSSTPPGASAALAGRAEDEVGSLETSTVESFVARDAKGVELTTKRLERGASVMSREEKWRLWPDADCEAGWKRFHERFPKEKALVEISRIGLNHDQAQALVAIVWQTTCSSGGALLYVLGKRGRTWHVVATVPVEEGEPVEHTPLLPPLVRDPSLVSARSKAGEEKRQREVARYQREWLGRCARVLAHLAVPEQDYELATIGRMKALEMEGFTQEDERACDGIKAYLFRRDELLNALLDRAFGKPSAHRARKVDRFDAEVRRLGRARVAALEEHAALFASTYPAPVPIQLSGDLDNVETDVRASLDAVARGVANEAFLERYLKFISEQERDPRTFRRPLPPLLGSLSMLQAITDRYIDPGQWRLRLRAAEADARARAGLSAAEVSLFERFLRFHELNAFRPDDEGMRQQRVERIEAHRAALAPDVVAWFESRFEMIRARVDATKSEARLTRWWPWPTPSKGKGPSLLVMGAHPDTKDARAPFSIRLLDATGKVRWRCEDIAVVEGRLEAPCLRAEGMLPKPGRYLFVFDAKGRQREFSVTIDGKELVVEVEVEVEGPEHRLTPLRVLPPPSGVTLTASLEGTTGFRAELVNGTSLELLPHRGDWTQAARLDHEDARGWVAAPVSSLSASSKSLAPGGSTSLAIGPRKLLRDRIAARVAARVRTSGLAESAVYELRSSALSLSMFGQVSDARPVPACVDEPAPPRDSPVNQLVGVESTAMGTWLRDGASLSRLDGERVVPVWSTKEPLHGSKELRDGRLLVHGVRSAFVSADGRSFTPLQTGVDDPRLIVEVGDDLLVADRDGSAVRVLPNGERTPVALPEVATWRGGAFDGQRGVLVSACHTLAVTEDGGRSWLSRPAPTSGPVLLHRGALYLAGWEGLFRSPDLGVSFEKVVDRPCRGLSARAARVTVACDADPDTRSGVLVADGGGPFVAVPSAPAVSMRAVSPGEGDALLAVSRNGLLFRGSSNGLQPVLLEDEDHERLLNLVTPSLPWIALDANGRPVF